MKTILMNRYELISSLLPDDVSTLLDVGCRDGVLRRYLPAHIVYYGVDMVHGPNVDYVCKLEKGLPFQDRAFDVVTALDVLEHVDNIWGAFEDLVRVADKHIIVVLPNIYHWSLRIRYIAGREMSKYRLVPDPVEDRHRWLISYNAACEFCKGIARKHGLSVYSQVMYGPRHYVPIDLVLNVFSKNLGSWSAAFVFSRK